MKIFIANCHTSNRGDEAAVRALVDELISLYPTIRITLGMRGQCFYPNLPVQVKSIVQAIFVTNDLKFQILKRTKCKIVLGRTYNRTVNELRSSDLILHAPGGPSIGDTYYDSEETYLNFYDILKNLRKPYIFCAPSMGPFYKMERNKWRRSVLNNAVEIILRDPISAKYVGNLLPDKNIYQTLDSALQHEIDMESNKSKLDKYVEFKKFLERHGKCVGITITDLRWHPIYSKDPNIVRKIYDSFQTYLKELTEKGYGIVFIPQLYGNEDDFNLMKTFITDEKNFFIIPDNDERYDTYFQQYVIGQLHSVIGMRYHSNIFSAKMGTPFISVSYEQKMQGFMERMNLRKYCIKIEELSAENLRNKYDLLTTNYDLYKEYLNEEHVNMKKEAYKITEIVKKFLEK